MNEVSVLLTKSALEARTAARLFRDELGELRFARVPLPPPREHAHGEVTLSQLLHWLGDIFETADTRTQRVLWEIYRPWYRELVGRHGPHLDLSEWHGMVVKLAKILRGETGTAFQSGKVLWFEGPGSALELAACLYDEWQAGGHQPGLFPLRYDRAGEEEVLVLAPGWDFQAFDLDFKIERFDSSKGCWLSALSDQFHPPERPACAPGSGEEVSDDRP